MKWKRRTPHGTLRRGSTPTSSWRSTRCEIVCRLRAAAARPNRIRPRPGQHRCRHELSLSQLVQRRAACGRNSSGERSTKRRSMNWRRGSRVAKLSAPSDAPKPNARVLPVLAIWCVF